MPAPCAGNNPPDTIAKEPIPTSVKVPRASARYLCIFPMCWRSLSEMSETGRVLRTGRLISAGALVEVREPHLDERAHRVLDAGLARGGERLLVALAHLLGRDALLEPVV